MPQAKEFIAEKKHIAWMDVVIVAAILTIMAPIVSSRLTYAALQPIRGFVQQHLAR